MKKFKVIIFLSCMVISLLGIINLSTDNSLISSLNQLALINSAQAEDLDPINVQPNKGNSDGRNCQYDVLSCSVSIPAGVTCTVTPVVGTMTLCLNDNENYCDYRACH